MLSLYSNGSSVLNWDVGRMDRDCFVIWGHKRLSESLTLAWTRKECSRMTWGSRRGAGGFIMGDEKHMADPNMCMRQE